MAKRFWSVGVASLAASLIWSIASIEVTALGASSLARVVQPIVICCRLLAHATQTSPPLPSSPSLPAAPFTSISWRENQEHLWRGRHPIIRLWAWKLMQINATHQSKPRPWPKRGRRKSTSRERERERRNGDSIRNNNDNFSRSSRLPSISEPWNVKHESRKYIYIFIYIYIKGEESEKKGECNQLGEMKTRMHSLL